MACLQTFTKFGFRTSTDKWPRLSPITHKESISFSLFSFFQSLSLSLSCTNAQLKAAEEASLRHLKLLISIRSSYMQPTVKCYQSNTSVSTEHNTHTHVHVRTHSHFLISIIEYSYNLYRVHVCAVVWLSACVCVCLQVCVSDRTNLGVQT